MALSTKSGSVDIERVLNDRKARTAARREALQGPSGIAGVVSNPRLLRLALTTSLGALCYGYEQGAYSQVLVMPSFTNNPAFKRIATDASYKGWSVSTLGLGGWLGALVNGYACDKFSRRWVLFMGSIVCLLGTALTTGAENPAYMFVGRFFIGLAVGSLSAAVPLYNSEIADANVRGTVVAMQQLMIVTGICISFWVGFGTNYVSDTNSVSWRLCLAGQGIPALLLCALSFTLPYTPRWLVKQNRLDEALRSLAYLRKRSEDDELVQLEFLEIRAEAEFDIETTKIKFPNYVGKGGLTEVKLQIAQFVSLFTTWHMFRRTAVACLMMFFQQMSGIDCIVYFLLIDAPTIFTSLGLPGRTVSLLASGVVGVTFVISTFPAIALIDRIGRRPLLLVGGVGMAVCLVLVAAISGTYQSSWASHQSAAWVAASFVWLYVGCFGASWGPCSWTVISEVFPLSTRSYGVALGASTNWMMNFVVSLVVPVMLQHITYGTYIFFLAFMLMALGYVVWILPETYGRSLEEMDLAFGSTEGGEDARRMDAIHMQLGLEKTNKQDMENDEKRSSKEQRESEDQHEIAMHT